LPYWKVGFAHDCRLLLHPVLQTYLSPQATWSKTRFGLLAQLLFVWLFVWSLAFEFVEHVLFNCWFWLNQRTTGSGSVTNDSLVLVRPLVLVSNDSLVLVRSATILWFYDLVSMFLWSQFWRWSILWSLFFCVSLWSILLT